MSMLSVYQNAIHQGLIHKNEEQQAILPLFQAILDAHPSGWFHKLLPAKKTLGIYLSGSVGIGKTFLLDLFYKQIPDRKMRLHFHAFMQMIDSKLRDIQGQKNPIEIIVKRLSKKISVLCLDEFLVNDIGHAMILSGLLKALFENNITLVTTSNTSPDKLYLNGLQRTRFMPAIALIKAHCHVIDMHLTTDYRLEAQHKKALYLYPLNEQNHHRLEKKFYELAKGHVDEYCYLTIQNRRIQAEKLSTHMVWFQFNTLCNQPRSQLDYIELASQYDIFFLTDIPILVEPLDAQVWLFILLVDILYDNKKQLFISAQSSLETLYQQGRHLNAFKRTLSRLNDMQSNCEGFGN